MKPKLLILDLDGTVYRGDDPVPGAAETIRAARAAGTRVIFATNRANRPPATIARQLRSMGVECASGDILTTASATASWCAAHGGGRCFLVGEGGLYQAFGKRGLGIARGDCPAADWVVTSLDRHFTYSKLLKAVSLIRGGARFVATNPDPAITIGEELFPGTGAISAAITAATGVRPTVIGKPEPTLFNEALGIAGCKPGEALVVGDNPETDIVAANAAGIPSCLLLTGITSRAEADSSPHRPSATCADWRELARFLGLCP